MSRLLRPRSQEFFLVNIKTTTHPRPLSRQGSMPDNIVWARCMWSRSVVERDAIGAGCWGVSWSWVVSFNLAILYHPNFWFSGPRYNVLLETVEHWNEGCEWWWWVWKTCWHGLDIACDGDSKSEIVVPILRSGGEGDVVAIIDIDCAELNGFDEVDQIWLEKLAGLLAAACGWEQWEFLNEKNSPFWTKIPNLHDFSSFTLWLESHLEGIMSWLEDHRFCSRRWSGRWTAEWMSYNTHFQDSAGDIFLGEVGTQID